MRIFSVFLSIMLCLTLLSTILTAVPYSAALDTTITSEITLNQEKTIISGDKYDYTIELINLDSCDKVLSVDFTCIPSIAVTINQIDKASSEIIRSETVEHLNFGAHELSLLYQELTITSLNVVNIFFIDNQAKVELTYSASDTDDTEIRITTLKSSYSIESNDIFTLKLYVENNGTSALSTSLKIENFAGAEYVLVGASKLEATNNEKSVTLNKGSNEISLQLIPLEEGDQILVIDIGGATKNVPISVLASTPVEIKVAGFSDIIHDSQIMKEAKMDLLYLFGFSIILIVLSGTLIFIHNNR